jgi:hypothetical protein
MMSIFLIVSTTIIMVGILMMALSFCLIVSQHLLEDLGYDHFVNVWLRKHLHTNKGESPWIQ